MNCRLFKSTLCVTTALGFSAVVPVFAQTANNSAEQIEEVTVTARRVTERLQDVPISITVFNQRQLTDRNVTSGADLATYTPSLSLTNLFGNDNVSFILRGFSQNSSTAPTVGVYFDDVVAPRAGVGGSLESAGDGAGPGDFFDLQNAQVVKGPQGTLFGRNTTGGAILLVPQKPTSQFGGFLEAGGGNYGMERTQGVINVPFDDKVRLRLGFDQETRDGYLKNVSGIGPSDFNNIDYYALRASLDVDVTSDVENYTVASLSRSNNNGTETQMFACNPKITIFGALSCSQLAQFKSNPGYNVENDLFDAGSFVRQWQVINTTTWNATDDLTVKNIASYAQYTGSPRSSLFGIDWTIPPVLNLGGPMAPTGTQAGKNFMFTASDSALGYDVSNQLTYTEELQLQGRSFGERLVWQAGFYMEGSDPVSASGTESPNLVSCSNFKLLQCTDVIQSILQQNFGILMPFGDVQRQIGSISYRDWAGYAQGTYAILDNLKFTGGIRFTDDVTRGSVNRVLWSFPSPNLPLQMCLQGVQNKVNCNSSLQNSSSAPTWLLDLDYTPVEDLLTYVKWARGYRTGGIVLAAPPGYLTFGPEHVDDYEVGEKYTINGPIPGLINVDAFYNKFRDQQLPIGFTVPPGTGLGSPTGGVQNLGRSRIYGFEAEAALTPYQGLTFDLSYTYLNTKVTKATPPIAVPGSTFTPTANITTGTRLQYTPNDKLSFTATYKLPVDESLGNISVSGTYTYTGNEVTGIPGPYQILPSYGLINFNVNWESINGGPIDAEFFMTNAANDLYATNIEDFSNILGFASRSLGEPRMFGARLRYHFGED